MTAPLDEAPSASEPVEPAAAPRRRAKAGKPSERHVLVLQGGGALGAYQAGAYAELAAAGLAPDWVAGISIGAINAAIIAGNAPSERVAKLRAFWERVSSVLPLDEPLPGDAGRRAYSEFAATFGALFGVPGFFAPRFPPAMLRAPGGPAATSHYDTEPLARTLADLVDFSLIGKRGVRLSVGAVDVETGNFAYFDSDHGPLTPAHVMASGALPPGFPPVEIDGRLYWDGGIVSNTPLHYVMEEHRSAEPMCIFQVDLFSARGPVPRTLAEVAQREKEIRYSSRTRMNTDMERELAEVRAALARLARRLPPELRDDADLRFLMGKVRETPVSIVHLINRREPWQTQSKDYEFSRLTVDTLWENGRRDVGRMLANKAWQNRDPLRPGVQVFDAGRGVANRE
jgi:NTE family protein